jgi:hypothetical protein
MYSEFGGGITKDICDFLCSEFLYIKIKIIMNWSKIQKDHYDGLTQKEIIKKYNISRWFLDKAKKEGKLKIIKHKYTHSKEQKKKISESRKKWLKENPDKHPWRNKDKFISKPCEKLKEKLKDNNIEFKEEIIPLKDKNYSIDIAIVEKCLGLEVNGNQHYNSDKNLKEYYKNRKNEIEKKGWKLIDIHYSLVFKDEFIDNLIRFINNQNKIDIDLDFKFYEKKNNYCECGKQISKRAKKCRECYKLKNNFSKRKKIKKIKINFCECGKEIDKRSKMCKECYFTKNNFTKNENKICKCGKKINKKSNMCNDCYQLSQRKVKRPSYEKLLKEIEEFGYTGTGRKYNVSDNAIRKWKKYYEKELNW